jgi:tight adherence protein B
MLMAHKAIAIAVVVVGSGVLTLRAALNPRGLLHRYADAYVSALDGKFRAMYMAERGARIAWLQLCAALAFLGLRAVIHHGLVLACAAAAVVLPPAFISAIYGKRMSALDAQVPGFALALANSLKTTASIGDALRVTAAVTAKPLKQDLDTVFARVKVGSTLEDALLVMAASARSKALDVVVSTVLIGRQTGGDMPRVLEGTAAALRELRRLTELTDKTIRGARRSLIVSASLTLLFVIILPRALPGFFDPLVKTASGQAVALQCVAAYLGAIWMGWRFTRIDV